MSFLGGGGGGRFGKSNLTRSTSPKLSRQRGPLLNSTPQWRSHSDPPFLVSIDWPTPPQLAGITTVNPGARSCSRPRVINKIPITCLVPVVCYFNTPFVPRLQSLSVTAINFSARWQDCILINLALKKIVFFFFFGYLSRSWVLELGQALPLQIRSHMVMGTGSLNAGLLHLWR